MNDVLKIFLSLSLSGSLMILVLFLCKHFLKDKLSRQWQYYVWLIVIARLLFPFAPETNLMRSIFQTVDHTIFQTDTVLQQHEQDNFKDMENGFAPNMEHDRQEENKPSIQSTTSQVIQDISTLLANNIWVVWLVIAFVLLIRKITIYQSFVHYVKSGQILISDIAFLNRLSVLARQEGVKRPVELCVNPIISSPLLVGFFNPCIVLPSMDISENDFQYIVVHELTHYKRWDMFYKWLVQVTICLHWFNPIVYIMCREINKACEFSCDEVIISKLDFNDMKEYGKTLLDAMVKVGNYKESLATVTLGESKQMLKERLDAIMNFKKKSKVWFIVMVILTISLCFGATVSGAAVSLSIQTNELNKSSSTPSANTKSNHIISQSYQTGEIISFGKFNNQDVKWKILEINNENKALLFAVDVLSDTWLPFDKTSNIWETSYIRSWLNGTKKGEFLSENNFTQDERRAIIQTRISTGILGNATNDYVFLISREEYYKYDIGNVPYDINSFWSRTGEGDSGIEDLDINEVKKYFPNIHLEYYPGSVALFASYHQTSGSFNASEKGGIRPMMWVDISALSLKNNSNIESQFNNQKSDMVEPNVNADTLSIDIQSRDNLISSTSGRRYMVYGPFDGDSIEFVTCQLNNEVEARLEFVLSGQNKTVEGVEITNCIGFGKTYTNTLFISEELLNSNEQFYVFIGSDNIKNLTGTISFSSSKVKLQDSLSNINSELSGEETPYKIQPRQTISIEELFIFEHEFSAAGKWSANSKFTLENSATINLFVDIAIEKGILNFYIKSLYDDSIKYQHTGNVNDKATTVFLEAGEYQAIISGENLWVTKLLQQI